MIPIIIKISRSLIEVASGVEGGDPADTLHFHGMCC